MCVCFDIAEEQSGYQVINGQISQVPGLSQTIGALPNERAQGRRAGVLESDSDYVKLAKQGGHKGTTMPLPCLDHPSNWLRHYIYFCP